MFDLASNSLPHVRSAKLRAYAVTSKSRIPAAVETLADPAVRQRLADMGQEISARDQQTPEVLGEFQRAEIEKWWPIIRATGIKGE